MENFRIGDRVSCYKGNGTITHTISLGVVTKYWVELDNGECGFFLKWSLEHLQEEQNNG